MTFHEKLKAVRLERGLSQPALSKLSGVPQQSIDTYEKATYPSWNVLQRLATALGVSCSDLTDDVISKKKKSS